jgi:hypothetical protein
MTDTTHLVALQNRLSNERKRLKEAKSTKERELRTQWVAQAEREVDAELVFLNLANGHTEVDDMDNDTLARELGF